MTSSIVVNMHDIGVTLLFTVQNSLGVVNLTSAQALTLYFQRPDRSVFSRPCATVTASAGTINYVTTYQDLNQAGNWGMQLVVRFADGRVRHSSIVNFKVSSNLG